METMILTAQKDGLDNIPPSDQASISSFNKKDGKDVDVLVAIVGPLLVAPTAKLPTSEKGM